MSNNFTAKAEEALNRSVTLAEELGHTYIGTEHVLLALATDETCCASILLKRYKITDKIIRAAIEEYSGVGVPSKLNSKDTTPKCRKLLENSYKIAKKYVSEKIGTEHLLLALLEENECVAAKILIKIEADASGVKEVTTSFLRSAQRSRIYTDTATEQNIPNLLKYGRNITAMAEKGELDPVIGREKETERLIRILSRKSKNNPCLIGEAGVGKTAIIEGLAQRIACNDVPPTLLGKIIISIDLTSMVAGAKYRGDFEERIKNIMSEAVRNKSVILFIDEIHTIVGAGSAEGAIDAANIMKPELSRGEIQLIGATTLMEYRKYIEKDSALERRFQPIIVEEPSVEGTIAILHGLKAGLEKHHNVVIDDSAIIAAAKLSERYIQDRFLPDKAIDILDEACSFMTSINAIDTSLTQNIRDKIKQTSISKRKAIAIQDYELATNLKELERFYKDELGTAAACDGIKISPPIIDEKSVRYIISELSGVDTSDNQAYDMSKLKEHLSQAVVGQNVAVERVADAVNRSRVGISDSSRPRGIFLFLGESGVGKTALAKALTKELFGSDEAMIRYDMSEFAEETTISRLIGSAPGYVGYDDQNYALERLRKHPYSLILLDEIEKAHPKILSLFLQVFDTGYLTDSSGRRVSFKNSYILMTSNIGADRFAKSKESGFIKVAKEFDARERIKDYFPTEFINRIDEVLLFSNLGISALKEIAKMKIYDFVKRCENIDLSIRVDEYVYEKLASEAMSRTGYGARGLARLIVTKIENRIADMIVQNEINHGDSILVTCENDEIVHKKDLLALKQ